MKTPISRQQPRHVTFGHLSELPNYKYKVPACSQFANVSKTVPNHSTKRLPKLISMYLSILDPKQNMFLIINFYSAFLWRGGEKPNCPSIFTLLFILNPPFIPQSKNHFPRYRFGCVGVEGERRREYKKVWRKPLAYKLKTKWKIDVYLIPFPKSLTLYLLRLPARPNQPSARPPLDAERGKSFLLFYCFY